MKPLLETTDPRYLRRLVRELNQNNIDGFYAPAACHVLRCTASRLKSGTLEVRSFSASPEWFAPSKHLFTDPYGREIVASRRVR